LPNTFTGPAGIYSPDVWLPLDDLTLFGTSPKLSARDTRWLFFFGRLDAAATVPQVQGQLDAAAAEMARDWPDTHQDRGARVRMMREGNSELRGLGYGAAIGMGIIGLVLLLACFNVANLLLARAVERERDMGLRAALGATPSRLVRLVVTEGFVIATLSGVLALLLAWWTQALVGAFAIPIEEPQHLNLSPDLNVLFYVIALIFVAGVLPGLWPAIASARIDVVRVLGSQGGTSSGGRPSRLRRSLVAAQIAGSTMFLALAALLVQSFMGMAVADYGFAKDQLILAEVAPATQGLDAVRSRQYIEAVRARLARLPGIASVAVADHAPFFIGFDRMTAIDGQKIPTYAVSPDYFKTMGIGLVSGREFSTASASRDAIVTPAFAKATARQALHTDDGHDFTVVGVTANSYTRGLDRPAIYVPLSAEAFDAEVTIVVRTAGEATPLLKSVVDAAHEVDPNIAMLSVKTMAQRMAVQLWPFHTLSWMFSICGGLALLMSTVGLSGMVIHAVNQRTREFGVRMSVGATSRDLMADVLKGSTALLLPGLIAGVILSAAGAQLIRVVFVGVNVLNPTTYLVVAALECLIVIVACVPPALRASRVDPLIALRSE
jgi:predicted permease